MGNKKSISLIKLLTNSCKQLRSDWLGLILVVFFIICFASAVIIVLTLIYTLLLSYQIIPLAYFFTFTLGWNILLYLVTFIISVIAQLLIINKFVNPEINLRANLKSLKANFKNFLFLNILIDILLLILSLPIYASLLLFFLQMNALAYISVVVGLILIFVFGSYILFSPFIIIEKKQGALEALRKSFYLAHGNISNIIFKLLILSLLLIIVLYALSFISLSFPFWGKIFNALFFLILIPFLFSYLFSMYQDYKA